MRVAVWSDVICPFCYIGKRKLERALTRFPARDRIEITWKSFQLQPDVRTDPAMNALRHLAVRKGWSMDFARQAAADVSGRAREVGLDFHYDKTIVANTFDAHRLAHFATSRGLGDEMQEALFKAYFTDGRNIGDHATLVELATGVGLPASDVRSVLASDSFADEVRRDIDEALQMGIAGVPFFVFDGKYAVSGAQDESVFLQALERSVVGWTNAGPRTAAESQQAACDLDGNCV